MGRLVLRLRPISFKEACAFVAARHRHHKPPRGWKFGVGVEDQTGLRGVAMVGRPVARGNDDGRTLEVNRVCTDGAKNACSMLYGASARAARALGYNRIITYILESETGASLRAAGWAFASRVPGRNWDTPSRRRVVADLYGEVAVAQTEDKEMWEKVLR